jgi:hypothetical protein
MLFRPGVIISAVINSPGSWHVAHVARPIINILRTKVPEGYFLVADTAFPRGPDSIAGKVSAPLSGDRVPGDPVERQDLPAYNCQLLSYRQTAEWVIHTLQGAFGRLRVPLPITSENRRYLRIEICARLTNVRACCVGISQIQSAYMPIWRASEDDSLWLELGDMLFGDIRKRDRVSRFHPEVVEPECLYFVAVVLCHQRINFRAQIAIFTSCRCQPLSVPTACASRHPREEETLDTITIRILLSAYTTCITGLCNTTGG